MIREVDLVSYLPEFMQGYKEPVAALKAEDTEFTIVWECTDKILYNHFISTADEYGIRRFEKLLDINPTDEDTLESRRSRCQSKWFTKTPYTWRVLLEKLTMLCGSTDFVLTQNFNEGYLITVTTHLELYGQVEELENMLNALLPYNMEVSINNALPGQVSGKLCMAGGVAFARIYILHHRRKNKWRNLENL